MPKSLLRLSGLRRRSAIALAAYSASAGLLARGADLTWAPPGPGNTWDIATTANFTPSGGGGPVTFANGDRVTFNDSTTLRSVALQPVGLQPASVTVNTSGTYTFLGGGGSLTGAMNLVKKGTGTLEIQFGDNNFTGGVTIDAGTVRQNINSTTTWNPLGTATIALNGTGAYAWTAVPDYPYSGAPTAGQMWVNGNNKLFPPATVLVNTQDLGWSWHGNGTMTIDTPTPLGLRLFGSMSSFTGTFKVTNATNRNITFSSGSIGTNTGSPSATFDLGTSTFTLILSTASTTFNLGTIVGGPNTAISGASNSTIVTGTAGTSITFAGIISGVSQSLVKEGNTKLTLGDGVNSRHHTYGGSTSINAGTLALVDFTNGNLDSRRITVASNAVLDFSGLLGGNLILAANQALINNGTLIGSTIEAPATSTIGGTKFTQPIIAETSSTISPGNSVGTLQVSSILFNGSSNFVIEVEGSTMDSIVIDDPVTVPLLGAIIPVNLVHLGGAVPGTYTLLDYNGSFSIQNGLENAFEFSDFPYRAIPHHDTANTRFTAELVSLSGQWRTNGNGTWNSSMVTLGQNWTLDGVTPSTYVPNAVTFGTFITAPRTVTVTGFLGNIANSIVFNSPHAYTVAGPATLTLDTGAASLPVSVLQGSHAINAPVRIMRGVSISTAAGTSLSFGGTIVNANNSSLTKNGDGTVRFTRLNMPTGSLTVSGGSVVMTPKATANTVVGTNVVRDLTIAPAASVDLTNNALIINYDTPTSQLTDLRAELADGRLFSSHSDATTTLGYRRNTISLSGMGLTQVSNFAGVAVDDTSIVIRRTYKGDANLDGKVNVVDLHNLAVSWLATGMFWENGDFDHNGIVNATDLGLLAQAWQLGANSPLQGSDFEDALTNLELPADVVPETSAVAIMGIGILSLVRRRSHWKTFTEAPEESAGKMDKER